MWCAHENADIKQKLRDYITYFEGTCEFCIGNMGIRQYLAEVQNIVENTAVLDDETSMLAYYIYAVILYKQEEMEYSFDAMKQAEELARVIGNREFIAKTTSYIAIFYYVQKQFGLSKKYFDEATTIFEELELYPELALHYINILWYKRYEEDKAAVSAYMDKAFYYVQLSNSPTDARIYLHLGYIYKTIFNDFIRGIRYLTTARDMCYRNENVEMECMTLHTLADGYLLLGHHKEALEIYRNILEDSRYHGITSNLKCMILSNVTACLIANGDYDHAARQIKNMRSHIDETQQNIKEQLHAVICWLTARLYISTNKKMKEVPALLDEADAIYAAHADSFSLEMFDYRLIDARIDYAIAKGDEKEAEKNLLFLKKQSDRYSARCKQEIYTKLADLYERKGDFEKSLSYHKLEMLSFDEIEKAGIVTQYDKLFKEFLRYTQKQKLAELKKEKKNLSQVIYIDDLTHLYNKAHYHTLIEKWENGIRADYSVIMIDIDHFKAYNDFYGHQKGDECLRKVAEIIRSSVAAEDGDPIRYGGEEFVVLLEGCNFEKTKEVALRLVENVEKAEIAHEKSPLASHVTISAGYYFSETPKEENLENMIEKADAALYRAKHTGRNRACPYVV